VAPAYKLPAAPDLSAMIASLEASLAELAKPLDPEARRQEVAEDLSNRRQKRKRKQTQFAAAELFRPSLLGVA
jgi:hypothetical protein